MTASSGWRAECQDCPTTIGWAFGETIRVAAESPDVGSAELWAMLHRQLHPGHHVTVRRFQRMDVTFTDVDPEVLRKLTGDP